MKVMIPIVSATFFSLAVMHVVHSGGGAPVVDPCHQTPRSPYAKTIVASGVVEPDGGIINVGSPLQSVVSEVLVRPGEVVRQDTPLFRLDDRQLRAALATRAATLAHERTKLAHLECPPRKEDVMIARARLEEVQAQLAGFQDALDRADNLFANRALSEADIERCRTNVNVTDALVHRAQAELQRLLSGVTPEELAVARSAVTEAEMQKAAIETEVERLTVRSPCDALVLRCNIRPGEAVSVTSPDPLVALAPLGKSYVRVDIADHQLTHFDSTAPAQAVPKGDPDHLLDLRFVRIEPICLPRPPRNGPRDEVDSRVMQVIYELDAQAGKSLQLGQELDVFIAAGGSR